MSKKADELKPIKKKIKKLKEIKEERSVLSEIDEHDIRYRCGDNIETYNTLRYFRLKRMQKRQELKDGETIIADEEVMKLAPGFEFNEVEGKEMEEKVELWKEYNRDEINKINAKSINLKEIIDKEQIETKEEVRNESIKWLKENYRDIYVIYNTKGIK